MQDQACRNTINPDLPEGLQYDPTCMIFTSTAAILVSVRKQRPCTNSLRYLISLRSSSPGEASRVLAHHLFVDAPILRQRSIYQTQWLIIKTSGPITLSLSASHCVGRGTALVSPGLRDLFAKAVESQTAATRGRTLAQGLPSLA